jgi:uroporphyrinogen decarboxylase
MSAREDWLRIVRQESERPGFWPGMPHKHIKAKLSHWYGAQDGLDLDIKMGSCLHNCGGESWQRRDRPCFENGVFADEDIGLGTIEAYKKWPTAADNSIEAALREINRTVDAGLAVMASAWGSIFTNTWTYFGSMENCFVRMHEEPETVHAVTRHVTDYYLGINEELYQAAGDKIDSCFIGIDMGSQLDLLISPDFARDFWLPYIREMADQAHSYGHYVTLHSCGAISRIIPDLIDLGVNVLHPIQARAAGMSAAELAPYRGRLVFMGGVDTQELLPNATPQEVSAEVERLCKTLGPNFIVSPSHEAPPENITLENYVAMAEAVRRLRAAE